MKKIRIIDFIPVIFALVLSVGAAFFFHACGPKNDGSWMLCHWAERSVVLLGSLATVFALVKLFSPDTGVKLGLSVAVFFVAVSAVFVPGNLIPLCKMPDMACRLLFKPGVLSIGLLLAALSLVDSILLIKKISGEKSAE